MCVRRLLESLPGIGGKAHAAEPLDEREIPANCRVHGLGPDNRNVRLKLFALGRPDQPSPRCGGVGITDR
ncbi:hypothetical protein ACFW6S_23465 [Streptomyces sp. NPDC058740]|uniref:hypothetical protein n=1 Tax=Streptomyces sp. NPDC058740 TaxID=3346619 RepID=UPI0036B193CD